MNRRNRVAGFVIILALLIVGVHYAGVRRSNPATKTDGPELTERLDGYYTLLDENENIILTTGHVLRPGDEYITEDDIKYCVDEVLGDKAKARTVGPMEALSLLPEGAAAKGKEDKGTVGIYHTHSDESYIPTDGTDSKEGQGGIILVGKAMAEQLEEKGVNVIHDTTLHTPHDAGAYDRSRRTAVQILKQRPAALFDVHRDAGPSEPYLTRENGKEVAKVMIVVGRTNPKVDTNLDFARRLKDAVNREHPGLIKGILLGKADFNQDLSQRALLLEVGTEKTSREAAQSGIRLVAGVVPSFLGIGPAPGEKGVGKAIGWLLGIAVGAIFIYLWVSTGSWEEMQSKIMEWLGSGGVRVGGGGGERPEGSSDSGGDSHE